MEDMLENRVIVSISVENIFVVVFCLLIVFFHVCENVKQIVFQCDEIIFSDQ